ncbi:MAG: hypothetical protein EBT86_01100 [Actinobacteria bacterium]|nr:hypothetical protein [Actinomycetota bacterium]
MFVGLSESLTLTIVLLLVFGSVCLYLYTRISQTEQKISLIESILLDLKMASDLRHVSPDMTSQEEEDGLQWTHSGAEHTPHGSGAVLNTTVYGNTDDDFSDVLQSAHSANDSLPPVELEDNNTTTKSVQRSAPAPVSTEARAEVVTEAPTVVPAAMQSVEPDVALASADLANEASSSLVAGTAESSEIPFESLDSNGHASSSPTQQPNLESLTAKELHSLAKQKGVAGESKMTRLQLIEALRALV